MQYGNKFRVDGYQVKLYRYIVTHRGKIMYFANGEEADGYVDQLINLYPEEAGEIDKQPLEVPAGDEWIDGITIPQTTHPMDTAVEIYEAGQAAWLNTQYIPSPLESLEALSKELIKTVSLETDTQKIAVSGLYDDWAPGKHEVGEIRNNSGQTWERYQAHDTDSNPDIVPGNMAWYTFWRPLHGTTPETARPWVKPQGSHDIYHAGEYMIYTDGETYLCGQDTNFGPDEYPQAWEKLG